ncbi:unnamed protein product [Durusdinium trenchii]|uniref:Tyrosine-protein kinase ephrin type A/B receptor-like domain-containing protein n=1 Tax=Durusdinium trenchii TaxID=1381693 RepID=A0ABP0NKP8_9DINO
MADIDKEIFHDRHFEALAALEMKPKDFTQQVELHLPGYTEKKRLLDGLKAADAMRKNLVNDDGASYPVGHWINAWEAGFATAEVAEILLKDTLGYNVTKKGPGANTVDGFYAIAGCHMPQNITDRGCGPRMRTYVHFAVEGWTAGYPQDLYVASRSNPADLLCRACPPGTSSEKLEDAEDTTFICKACPSGSYQVSGASLTCNPCPLGEYQDETASISCKRCGFGVYQNATGQSTCIPCPAGTTTVGFTSMSISDCGCKEDTINVLPAASSNFQCQLCGEGLRCPFGSSIESLMQGQAALGDDYVPQVLEGYVAPPEEPLKILKCRPASRCPGGKPGQCAGGLSGMPCASCEAGKAWSGTKCQECGANVVLWAVGMPVAAAGLIAAYYLVNSEVMAKASAFQA